jgi:hypothetical protein
MLNLEAAMKKITLLSIILLAVTATAALAGSIDLVWNDYYGYSNGTFVTKWACWNDFGKVNGPANPAPTNYDSPCDVSSEADPEAVGMMCSFQLTANMPDFFGTTSVLDGQVGTTDLPLWWEMYNSGSCRPTSLTSDADFTGGGVTAKAYKKGCLDPYAGGAQGGVIAYQSPMFPVTPAFKSSLAGPSSFRIKVAYALTGTSNVLAANEYYGAGLKINFLKTITPPFCAGCLEPGAITLNEILVDGVTSSERITTSVHNNHLQWHGGNFPTPARNSTWGQVKSLYR